MELTVIAVKRSDNLYHFNHSHNDTVEQLLLNGTEVALDDHFYFKAGKYPVVGDEIEVSIYTESPDDYDTILLQEVSDEDGTYYTDTTMDLSVWLCPWLQGYFGYVPEEIYVKVRPINKGLEAFVKRTGMRGFLQQI